ncbi:unnamed protein product [Lampetra fluviatilis]
MGAGTGAEISVKIRGACDTLSATLSSSTTGLTPFLYGQTDEFHVTGDHVGPLFDVTVWHDGSGYYSAWHLERVEVDESPGVTVEFPCNCWVYGNTPITLKPQLSRNPEKTLSPPSLGTMTRSAAFAGCARSHTESPAANATTALPEISWTVSKGTTPPGGMVMVTPMEASEVEESLTENASGEGMPRAGLISTVDQGLAKTS